MKNHGAYEQYFHPGWIGISDCSNIFGQQRHRPTSAGTNSSSLHPVSATRAHQPDRTHIGSPQLLEPNTAPVQIIFLLSKRLTRSVPTMPIHTNAYGKFHLDAVVHDCLHCGLAWQHLGDLCCPRFSKMQTVTNIYILNLAIADECFLIGIPFLLTTMHLGEWTFGSTMCKAFMVSTSITQFTSSIFLFIMSADRYLGELTCFCGY